MADVKNRPVVTRDNWLDARVAFTRLKDDLARQRRDARTAHTLPTASTASSST
jgi:hypothetical protein